MHHLDDHTIELFVTGSHTVAGERPAIEEHLAACPSCKATADRMAAFYLEFSRTLGEADFASPNTLPARSHRRTPLYHPQAGAVQKSGTGPLTSGTVFVRRHPIAATSGLAALLLGLALVFAIPVFRKDPGPVRTIYNAAREQVEILDRNGDVLWTLPTHTRFDLHTDTDLTALSQSIAIHDLDGDGVNEVLSILRLADEEYNHTLRIYDARDALIRSTPIVAEFRYLDRTYSPNIDLGAILVDDFGGNRTPEIWITGNSRERSPGVTMRLDAQGNVLGSYWHFGQLRYIYSIPLGKDGSKSIVLTGVDDAEDSTHGEFPVIVVLDPAKISGERRSLRSTGFAFAPSDAERFIVALPLTDMNTALQMKPDKIRLVDTSATTLVFRVSSLVPGTENEMYQFDYFFDKDLRILEVKANSQTEVIRQALLEQGKVTGPLDRTYLEALKDGVRYLCRPEMARTEPRLSAGPE
jgi:hypothetical protein